MSTDNPYAPPKAIVERQPDASAAAIGSIEGAVEGRYSLDLGALVRAAWQAKNGHKLVLVGAAAIQGSAGFLAGLVIGYFGFDPTATIESGQLLKGIAMSQLQAFALMPLTVPLNVGLTMMAVDIARHGSTRPSRLFAYYRKMPRLVAVSAIVTVMTMVGYALLIVPGVYLQIAYGFAVLLVADRDLDIWQALETSKKAVNKRWVEVAIAVFASTGIALVGLFAFGIGIIWTLPTGLLVYAMAYRIIFGDPEGS